MSSREFVLVSESWVSFSQDGMSVSWNDISAINDFSDISNDGLLTDFAWISSSRFNETEDPLKNLLVSQSVEWSSQSVQTGRERQVRVGESRSNQMGRVGGNVSSLMVSMDGQISSEALLDSLTVESEHVSVVSSPVQVWVGWDDITVVVLMSVNDGSNFGNLGSQIKRIFQVVLPVVLLVGLSSSIDLVEFRVSLFVQDGHREHSHWVGVSWEAQDEVDSIIVELSSFIPLIMDGLEFLLVWKISSHQQPE